MEDKQVMNRQTSSKELHLVSCGWEKCTPSQSYGPGVRRYYTIHFVLKGQGYFYINNRKYSLKAGQCFFIPPEVSTLYKAEPANPWTYTWICFNGEQAATLSRHCHLTIRASPAAYLGLPLPETILEMMTRTRLTPANESLYPEQSLPDHCHAGGRIPCLYTTAADQR
ncbi:MAG: AraC family ligand binding domain-containing protein [Ruminococcus sp.]